jgi:hypothetical protein
VAEVVGLELRNVVAKYSFESSHGFPEIQPNSGPQRLFAFELRRASTQLIAKICKRNQNLSSRNITIFLNGGQVKITRSPRRMSRVGTTRSGGGWPEGPEVERLRHVWLVLYLIGFKT